MSKKLQTAVLIFLPLLTLLLGWQLGVRAQAKAFTELESRLAVQFGGGTGSGTVAADPEKEVDPSLLWTTWRMLLSRYIDPEKLASQNLLYGAVRGMVQAVGDPYTVFMTPEENGDFRRTLSGDLEGIGAELALRNGAVLVVSPLKGSPAQRAGLEPGDEILAVNKESTEGKTLQDIVQRIRGPKGTSVTLSVIKEDEDAPKDVVIVREKIHIPSVESRVDDANGKQIGVLTINQFGDDTTDGVRAALEEFLKQPLTGIVMDLRYNGGGYLDSAVDIVSFFQKQGKVVSVERREGSPQQHYVSGRPIVPDLPMVVLINAGSASASEITAGALQDNKRATIMGVQSFGKGTVQEVVDLPGGASLRVTIAKWLTPDGHDLGKQGVTPDLIDEQPSDLKDDEDPQLDAALEFLRTGKKPAAVTHSSSSAR